MPLSWSADVVAVNFVAGKTGTPADPFGLKALGVNALNPIEQMATAPNREIMVVKVAAARKTFAGVEIQ